MSQVKVYYASVSSSIEMKKQQQRITMVLESQKIAADFVDITQRAEDKDKMRMVVGDPTALPPQICNGDHYCGDFAGFERALEDDSLPEFLKLVKS